jgi:plasmid maintenance system killer protein
MFRIPLLSMILTLAFLPVMGAENKDIPAQAARGKAFFLDANNKGNCSTCHELDKAGTPVGPNLINIARVSPKGIEIAILSSRTMHVKEVELKVRKKFPAMIVSESPQEVVMYSLGSLPPEKMTVDRNTIYAIRDNGSWKHPPESAKYTKEQLADVMAYIRFIAYGDTKGVDPDSLQ